MLRLNLQACAKWPTEFTSFMHCTDDPLVQLDTWYCICGLPYQPILLGLLGHAYGPKGRHLKIDVFRNTFENTFTSGSVYDVLLIQKFFVLASDGVIEDILN